MTKPDIEILDDSDAYAYSSHIAIDGHELQYGDLLLIFKSADSSTVAFFERVYGFTWPGIITHVIDGAVPAEFHKFESIASELSDNKVAVAHEREQSSYYTSADTVRTLTLYRYVHDSGWQPILTDEHYNPTQRDSANQSVVLCANAGEVIEELFEERPIANDQEIEQLREFLLSSGYKPESIPTVDDTTTNSTD